MNYVVLICISPEFVIGALWLRLTSYICYGYERVGTSHDLSFEKPFPSYKPIFNN